MEIACCRRQAPTRPQLIGGNLLGAEIDEKHTRWIVYQLGIAQLPLAKDIDDFQFEGTPNNQNLVNVWRASSIEQQLVRSP
jgi:hypothetical protein